MFVMYTIYYKTILTDIFEDCGEEDSGYFQCTDTNDFCIDSSFVCDNITDCLDSQDEVNCGTMTTTDDSTDDDDSIDTDTMMAGLQTFYICVYCI